GPRHVVGRAVAVIVPAQTDDPRVRVHVDTGEELAGGAAAAVVVDPYGGAPGNPAGVGMGHEDVGVVVVDRIADAVWRRGIGVGDVDAAVGVAGDRAGTMRIGAAGRAAAVHGNPRQHRDAAGVAQEPARRNLDIQRVNGGKAAGGVGREGVLEEVNEIEVVDVNRPDLAGGAPGNALIGGRSGPDKTLARVGTRALVICPAGVDLAVGADANHRVNTGARLGVVDLAGGRPGDSIRRETREDVLAIGPTGVEDIGGRGHACRGGEAGTDRDKRPDVAVV